MLTCAADLPVYVAAKLWQPASTVQEQGGVGGGQYSSTAGWLIT